MNIQQKVRIRRANMHITSRTFAKRYKANVLYNVPLQKELMAVTRWKLCTIKPSKLAVVR